MKDTKQKTSSIAITFYVLAVLLLLVFAFMAWYTFDSVKEAMNQYGVSFSEFWGEMWKSIMSMFVTQSLPYLVYAFISYGIGYMLNEISLLRHGETTQNADSAMTANAQEQTADEKPQGSIGDEVQTESVCAENKEETQTESDKAKQDDSDGADSNREDDAVTSPHKEEAVPETKA